MKKLGIPSALLFLGLSFLTACGGSDSHPAISVSIAPGTATVQAGQTAQFTATVTNDSANKGVTWTVSCSSSSCGSVSPATTPSGTATTYTAAATPPSSTLSVTITATSVGDTTKTATATITVPAASISVAPSSATVQAGSTKQFTATVTNASNTGVSWTLTQGGSACSPGCGTLSSSTANPVTYTAPAAPPSSGLQLSLTATSAVDSTKTSSAAITVPAIAVTISPTSATVEATKTQNFTATVSNDPASAGVNWTLTQNGAACLPANCGSLSNATTSSVTYNAPATPPASDAAVVLIATSATDTSKSAQANITVPAITVSVSPTSPTIAVNTTQNFTASVSNDPASAGVTWTLTQSGTACAPGCGSLSNVTATSVTYTAPATVPTSPTVTLTATSVTDTRKTVSATITVTSSVVAACGSGSESLLNGHYAFVLKGFDNSSPANPVLIGGVLTLDGTGKVTAGTIDMNLNSGVQTALAVTTASSSYSVGSDHRGCMVLATSAGTQNYRLAVASISSGVASTGGMIDSDAAGPFTSGPLLKQDTTAFSTTSISSNYAFGISSALNPATSFNGVSGGKFAGVGVVNLAAGVVTGGEFDANENGQLDFNSSNSAFPATPGAISAGGTYTIDATSGRGTMTFTPTGATAIHAAIYVISANEIRILNTDNQTNSIFAGTGLKQSGTFSNASFNATSVVYESSLGSTAGDTKAQIGLVTGNSSGGFTITGYQNDSGTFAFQSATNGNYSIDSTGRMTTSGTAAGNHPPVLYLVSANEAFFLDGGGSVSSGFAEPQSAGPFSSSSLNGTFAFRTIDPDGSGVSDESGVVTFDGTSALSGTGDSNSLSGQDLNSAINTTYSVDSNGLVHDPSGCTVAATSTTCDAVMIIISATKAVRVESSSKTTSPAVEIVQQ